MNLPSVFQNDGQSVRHMTGDILMPACHIHNHNEMVFMLRGSLTVENNCDRMRIDAPAVIIHNSFTLHRVQRRTDEDYERYVINFDDHTLERIPELTDTIGFFKSTNMTVIRLDTDIYELLIQYMKRYAAVKISDGSYDLLTCLILYEIAQYRSQENTVRLNPKIPYINEIMHYISLHYDESLTLDELTSKYYVSRAKLVADFRNVTGMTIKQYITLVRMNVARALLVEGVSVRDASLASGYNSKSNFSATFQKYFGVSPMQYREHAETYSSELDL